MKVKVTYVEYKTQEVEISDEFKPLANWEHTYTNEECEKAIQTVEKIMGMPFGDENCDSEKFIIAVVDSETDEPMLEW